MGFKNKYNCLLWISTNRVAFFILFFLACPVWGQALEKIDLTPKDFPLWHHLLNPKISENGKWATFLLQYENTTDTLIVQNTIDKSMILFPNATKEQFIGSKWLAFKQANKLIIYNLENKTSQKIHDVIDYKVSPNNKFVITLSGGIDNKNATRELRIFRLGQKEGVIINQVEDYRLNDSGDLLAYVTRKNDNWTLNILELNTSQNTKTLLNSIGNPLKKMVWGSENNLALFKKNKDGIRNKVVWFNDVTQPEDVIIFNLENRSDIQKGYVVLDNPSAILKFSKNGKRLFFHLQKRPDVNEKDNHGARVQVWNAQDKLIYPAYNGNEDFFREPPFMVCWYGKNNSLFPLGDNKSSKSILVESSDYIFSHSLLDEVLPYDERRDNTPINVYNLKSGKKDFVMWRSPYMPIKISPTGRYLTYFDENDWWIYDAKNQNHSNVTKNISSSFKNEEYDWSGVVPPYGIAGYTKNDHSVLLYDKYDIWEVSTDGTVAKRLTFGREINKTYKIVNTSGSKTSFGGYVSPILNLQEGIILSSKDSNGGTGYFRLTENKALKPLIEIEGEVGWIQKAKNVDTYLYTLERFNMSPKLMFLDTNEKLSIELFRSNPHQEKYKWGRSVLLNYSLPEGNNLKGALFYPAGFDPAKYYPMVVFIYEKMSGKLHKYENPTLLTGADINITNLTTRGYFVFCPDIAYTINDVGNSALKSVEAGIKKVLKTAPIHKNKIGLFGHSFGGYETSFIIGNTNTFAAAISSAGIHDLKSFYFSIAWLWNLPQSGKFLNGQARFSSPFFNETSLYEKNSPINYAPFINTPLLTITGDKDTNVNWEQSVKMYNALRLLNKGHILLIYPEEGHDFFGVENQTDMTYKRWQWFDHYLKNEEKHPWMIPYN